MREGESLHCTEVPEIALTVHLPDRNCPYSPSSWMSLAHGATSSVQVWGEESLEVIFPARLAGDYLFLLTCGDRYLALCITCSFSFPAC